jgi:hypothetical protein
MRFKLPKTYKLLLALAVVAGPFIWLVLTEDGQRRSDLVVLHLLGHRAFDVALDKLAPTVSMALIREQFPRVAFDCGPTRSNLGEERCAARIGSFNGVPARAARLWLHDDALRALRLDYRRRYHALLAASLEQSFGEPERQAAGGGVVLAWRLEEGMLLLPELPGDDDDAALMWVAAGAD